jgi:hypothetical protein
MTYFVRDANTFRLAPEESIDLHKSLPVGNYVLKSSMTGLYLEQVDPFPLPPKLYGDTNKQADRILGTFLGRPASTGVMLTGEKGSGKTLLAKLLAARAAAEHNIPTLIINEPFHGDGFNTFIQAIEQPALILFDEFEKVYDNDDQEGALTLLDGVFPTKKLFVITCNDKWRVNAHMRNRPGRIFYMLEYKGLPPAFIREYCQDNLNRKDYINKVCEITSLFTEFNFDMLKALVEEMNRYDETPQEALHWLNAKPEYMGDTSFDVELYVNEKKIEPDALGDREWRGNPLNGEINISWIAPAKNDPSEYDGDTATFTSVHIKKVDADAGKFTFANDEGQKLVLTRKVYTRYNYLDAF